MGSVYTVQKIEHFDGVAWTYTNQDHLIPPLGSVFISMYYGLAMLLSISETVVYLCAE